MSFSLKLLGGVALAAEAGPVTGPAVQRHRLALLALLASSRPRAVSRDKLMALLWPERESEPARRLLNQAVHALRQTLGADAILSTGDDLQLNPGVLNCDVVAFEEALAAGEAGRAVAVYTGPFLDGFFLDDAPEFERWVDRERSRLAAACAKALETLAEAAERTGDHGVAVERWRDRSAQDPYDSRIALRLMQALERAGNRAGALQHAVAHQQLLREELEIEPAPEIQALVERLRQEPASVPARRRGPAEPVPVAPPAEPTWSPPSQNPPRLGAEPARRRPIYWFGAAALLLAAGIGGAIRVAGARGAREKVPTPKVVDEIAQAVARELDRRERGDTARRLPQHRTRSVPAYELYLRGDDPALLRSQSGARQALEYFRRAVALDSNYAVAWAGIARMTFRISDDNDPAAMARARTESEAAVRKALALDDSLGEAHGLLGVLRGMDYDFPAAERHFRQAIALEPNPGRVREWYVQFLLQVGRPAEGLAEAERNLALEPRSPAAIAEVARALLANDRCEEALARLETIAALDPPLLRALGIRARCYGRLGRWADAIALLRPGADQGDPQSLSLLGYMLVRSGRRAEALPIQKGLRERWEQGRLGAYHLAFIPAALGDRDEAFTWLDRAYVDRSLGFNPGVRVYVTDPPFADLRGDARMDRLLARLGIQNR